MDGTLIAKPEQIITVSNSFSTSGTAIKNLTTQMTELVTGLSAIWTGEAANMYTTKFNGLQDDIAKIDAKIQEHASDLNEIASRYIQAESSATGDAQPLKTDAIT